MQVALQGGQRHDVVRLTEPALQRLTGAIENIHSLFEEDLDHFLIEVGVDRAEAQFGLGLQFQASVLGDCRFGGRLLPLHRLGLSLLQLGSGLVQLDDFQPLDARRQQGQGMRIDGFAEQLTQRLYALGLRADLQGRSDLIHHADQRFVSLFRFVEEAFADGQAAFLDGTIEIQQGLAELVDLRQLGHFGATTERGQLFQQRRQLLALGRMLAPFTQQVLGIQQDVHAFGEEDADHLRIAAFTALCHALVFGVGETFLMQRLDAGKECLGAGNRCQRLSLEIVEPDTEHALGAAQQLGGRQIHLNQIGLELLDQLLQRRSDFCHRQDAGHIGTALEGVQGTLQVVGDWLRQLLGAIGEKAHQGIQMGFRLVAEDFQQLWVKGLTIERLAIERLVGDRLDLLDDLGSVVNAHGLGYLLGGRGVRFWGRQTLGQGMRGGRQ